MSLADRLKYISARPKVKWHKIKTKNYEVIPSPNNVEIATLAHGLEKVLLRPGVHYLRDPKTKEYNFSPYLENIVQPSSVNFDALSPYITSSKDTNLLNMAKDRKSRYIGSTSSISAVLSQFYFTMSNFKALNMVGLSPVFQDMSSKFTRGTRVAASIYLRWKDGVYAIDAEKGSFAQETVLSELGKSLEKVLTLKPEEFSKYLKTSTEEIDIEERNRPESYAYGQYGDFLLRSQLDCHHPSLSRKTFDLKTRAAIPVRLDVSNYKKYVGYSLKKNKGLYESYEREYYDMIRSAFLKYIFQVRIGHMDGILVAYHNTSKMFGFQYISREEMDKRIFGSSKLGDKVFKNSLSLLQSVLNEATKKYPKQTLRMSFDSYSYNSDTLMRVFVEAVSPGQDERDYESIPYENLTMYKLQTISYLNGREVTGELQFKNPRRDKWNIHYNLAEVYEGDMETKKKAFEQMRQRQATVYQANGRSGVMLDLLYEISMKTLSEEANSSVNK
ncbi:mitochondrial protein Pet127-domain-containing protein [Sporodiniella umbellata]|nr:mitochondrial protein Pet127-domain-containing protein [Sporodiniella umbellata]